MKKINLQNILSEKLGDENLSINDAIREAMKEACKQILKLASENAYCDHEFDGAHGCEYGVNKQSILDTITQVE